MKTIPIDEVCAKHMTPASIARAKAKAAKILEEMELREIREALKITLAKIEKQPDMQIATLRKVVRALGGDIDIIARFPKASVRIKLPA